MLKSMSIARRTILAFFLVAFSIIAALYIAFSETVDLKQDVLHDKAHTQADGVPVGNYPWLTAYDESQSIARRIPVPENYERVNAPVGSFEHWLRYLPLKEGRPQVYLYNGGSKKNQNAHFAVVNIDAGKRDLQQCADAVMRVRAEYLYSLGRFEAIHFNFTSGDRADFAAWASGYRPFVFGNIVRWIKLKKEDYSYKSFRAYMDSVFRYAGSASLSKELYPVEDVHDMQVGDVFIRGGFPGHAVIVVDMALNRVTGKKIFLLAQSYMPAQDIHVLKNSVDNDLDPWYSLDFGKVLRTPEWDFRKNELMRF